VAEKKEKNRIEKIKDKFSDNNCENP